MESTSQLPTNQQAIANKRREKDILKLMISDYEVTRVEEKTGQPPEFLVKLKGPPNSPYENVINFQLTLCRVHG